MVPRRGSRLGAGRVTGQTASVKGNDVQYCNKTCLHVGGRDSVQ